MLIALWEASNTLSLRDSGDPLVRSLNVSSSSNVPRAPHLENCKDRARINNKLDGWGENGTRPLWTLWKGQGLGLYVDDSFKHYTNFIGNHTMLGLHPPWVMILFIEDCINGFYLLKIFFPFFS